MQFADVDPQIGMGVGWVVGRMEEGNVKKLRNLFLYFWTKCISGKRITVGRFLSNFWLNFFIDFYICKIWREYCFRIICISVIVNVYYSIDRWWNKLPNLWNSHVNKQFSAKVFAVIFKSNLCLNIRPTSILYKNNDQQFNLTLSKLFLETFFLKERYNHMRFFISWASIFILNTTILFLLDKVFFPNDTLCLCNYRTKSIPVRNCLKISFITLIRYFWIMQHVRLPINVTKVINI